MKLLMVFGLTLLSLSAFSKESKMGFYCSGGVPKEHSRFPNEHVRVTIKGGKSDVKICKGTKGRAVVTELRNSALSVKGEVIRVLFLGTQQQHQTNFKSEFTCPQVDLDLDNFETSPNNYVVNTGAEEVEVDLTNSSLNLNGIKLEKVYCDQFAI